jgi:hypothetical protein
MAQQARDAASNAASAAYSSAAQAQDVISKRGGQAADQVGQFVREQPVLAFDDDRGFVPYAGSLARSSLTNPPA